MKEAIAKVIKAKLWPTRRQKVAKNPNFMKWNESLQFIPSFEICQLRAAVIEKVFKRMTKQILAASGTSHEGCLSNCLWTWQK